MAFVSIGAAPAVERAPAILPLPREVAHPAGSYQLPVSVTVAARDSEERGVASFLMAYLRAVGVSPMMGDASKGPSTIRLSDRARDATLGSEGYRLNVDETGIAIEANTGAGLFYGLQTLEQVMSTEGAQIPGGAQAGVGVQTRTIPNLRIVDWPQYRWRGIHLDVSRHFFPVPVVERYIDLAARYKLNVFHWHLTDDQGWRIEIKRYPKLTQIGSCRAGTQVGGEGSTATDGRRYCGYYTQAQIRDVVAYAKQRYMTILPEIEMPGHSVEALAAYPWLACSPRTYQVRELWGVSTEIFCPTERTFAFLDDVLREVGALFPGEYVHIGGDEVPKDAWQASAAVAALRKREHLDSYAAVQGYFTRRIEAIAAKYHRRIVGWDEILDGGVTRQATVMSWRGTQGGVMAAKRGNDAVMTPDPPLYLDAYQGNGDYEPLAIGGLTTLKMVYDYDPMPPGLSAEQARHILGAQANLWTEYVPTSDHLFYMLLPRELALAELCWTPRARMNWDDFSTRLGPELRRLEAEGYRYRIPLVSYRLDGAGVEFPEQQPVANHTDVSVAGSEATLVLRDLAVDGAIHFTSDGTLPTAASPVYTVPFHVTLSGPQPVTVAAVAVLPGGRASAPSFLRLTQRSR